MATPEPNEPATVGSSFDITHVSQPATETLPTARAKIHAGGGIFEKHPMVKFRECHPPSDVPEAQRLLDKYFQPDAEGFVWMTLIKVQAPPAKGQSAESAAHDVIYIIKLEATDPEGRDPHEVFWDGYNNYPEVSESHAGIKEFMSQQIAFLAAGNYVPYVRDADPGKFVSPGGTITFAPTVLDGFPLHTDPKRNPEMVDRPGVTRPTFNIGAAGSFSSLHPEDGYCDSVNFLSFGRSKKWLGVDPRDERKLSNKVSDIIERLLAVQHPLIMEHFKPNCITPLNHKIIVLNPVDIDFWNIPYELVSQNPGDLMSVRDWCIHWALNAGSNRCAATNVGGHNWNRGMTEFLICKCGHDGCKDVARNKLASVKPIPMKINSADCEAHKCQGVFVLAETKKAHALAHKGVLHHVCGLCRKAYLTFSVLSRHLETCDRYGKDSQCPKCKRRFAPELLILHRKDCVLSCPCGKTGFRTLQARSNHTRFCPATISTQTSSVPGAPSASTSSGFQKVSPLKRKSVEASVKLPQKRSKLSTLLPAGEAAPSCSIAENSGRRLAPTSLRPALIPKLIQLLPHQRISTNPVGPKDIAPSRLKKSVSLVPDHKPRVSRVKKDVPRNIASTKFAKNISSEDEKSSSVPMLIAEPRIMSSERLGAKLVIRRRRPRTLSTTEATETQSPANLAPAAVVSGENRPVGVVGPMPSETAASPTLTVPQASAPSINQLLLAYSCGCCGPALLSCPSTASTPYSPTPAPTPADSRAPTPVNVSAPVISVEVQAFCMSVASGSSGTHPFPPLDRPSSEYDLVRVVSDVRVPRVGEIPVEPVRRDPQHHAELARLIETQNYFNSIPPLPSRRRFPFARRDVAGNKGRPLQFPAVNSAGNPSSVRGENNSARDTVSSTGDTASFDREPFPIVSGLLNSNPVVELPPSEPANDVLNDPRVAEALEARVEAGVHVPDRAPEPDRPNEVPEVESARAEPLKLPRPPGDIQAFSNEAPTSGLVLPASDITLDADYRVLPPTPNTVLITEEPFLNYLPIMIHSSPTESILFPRE
ncbi:hypothetical protein QAD02_003673 [Eretmocerus hayati]|uniref:Uncharacterized protein n=1 Tax=Eretmocerus hayati TaxID=131215 RepID=A0ACC2NMC2_9HYME|nr:hypothetical protein QAD02_003673 [Eretmocerus hayati]